MRYNETVQFLRPGFKLVGCHLIAMWSWTSYQLSLISRFLKCKVWGTIPHIGNVARPPLRKTSGERGWRAGPTSMDKFSSGKSGLHCTQTAMRLALAKKLPHPELRKQMFTEYFYLPRIWARPPRYGTKPFRPFLLLHCKYPPLMYSVTPSPVSAKISTPTNPMNNKWGPSLM